MRQKHVCVAYPSGFTTLAEYLGYGCTTTANALSTKSITHAVTNHWSVLWCNTGLFVFTGLAEQVY